MALHCVYQIPEQAAFRNTTIEQLIGTLRYSALLQKQPQRAWCTRCEAAVLLFASGVSLSYILPVDYIPNSFQVIRSDVFILKVIRMLPHVDPQQRNQTCWEGGERRETVTVPPKPCTRSRQTSTVLRTPVALCNALFSSSSFRFLHQQELCIQANILWRDFKLSSLEDNVIHGKWENQLPTYFNSCSENINRLIQEPGLSY